MATEHTVGFEPADRLAKDRESVRRRFWLKLKRVVARLPFAEDLLAAYYCAFDRETPHHVQAALLGAVAYFILPFDFVPDMLPVLGFTDDAAVLATAIRPVASHITSDHREAARAALKRVIDKSEAAMKSRFAATGSTDVVSSAVECAPSLTDAGSPCPSPCGPQAPSRRRRFAPAGRCGRHAMRSCLPRSTSPAFRDWRGSWPH